MYQNKSITLVIPCLNEENGIKEVISRVPACVDEIIVVDNGSTDRTAAVAESSGARVIIQLRKGYGRAYMTGFKQCHTDIIATADGDGTYPVGCIPEMAELLIERRLDFVSGNRFPLSDHESMKSHLVLGNRLITAMIGLVFGLKLKDGLSGMWVFNRCILDTIRLRSNRWSFSQEIKIETIMHRLAFEEYHIPYADRIGNSKLGPLSVGIENILYLFWHRVKWTAGLS